MTKRICVALVTCVTTAALVVVARGAGQQPTFRAGVRTVAVYATVSDREGRLVPDLQKEQFRVLDNGRPADITNFSNQPQAITVAVMLDTSGSMGVRVMRVRESTERFIDAIAPGDRARLGTFGWALRRRSSSFKKWVGRMLARYIGDLHAVYTLGFSAPALDGELHTLDVRVRKAGLKVRARQGYVARPHATPGTE